MDFTGKLALITGAASGIGAATTRLMVERGAHVFAVDINQDNLNALTAELGESVIPHLADMADSEQVSAMVHSAIAALGGLDILVSNAGIGSAGRIGDIDPSSWRRVMAINLDATFFAVRAALPELIRRRGNIVATASVSGVAGDYNISAYNTAKAGLLGMIRNIAVDYAMDGVRANAVSPGYTITPMSARMPDIVREAFTANVPMQRGGTSEEVAEAICFLASERASYVTGQNIAVDGGLLAHTGQPNFIKLTMAELKR